MAFAFILDSRGGTRAQYDQVRDRIVPDRVMPPGGLFHAAGSYEGGWRVIDMWESPEVFVRFLDGQIFPAITEAGMQPPTVRPVEAHKMRKGNGREPVVVQVVTLPGLDQATFDAKDKRILRDGLPPNLTHHLNGPVEGGWCVVDGWDSAEARDEFLRTYVVPAFQDGSLAGRPAVEDLYVEATLRAYAGART